MATWDLKPRDESRNSHRCDQCTALISWFKRPDISEENLESTVRRLGSVGDLRCSTCPLLQFFSRAYERFAVSRRCDSDRCVVEAFAHNLFRHQLPLLKGSRRSWAIDIRFLTLAGEDVAMVQRPLEMRLVADDLGDLTVLGNNTFFDLGRIIEPDKCSELTFSALSDCLRDHGEACDEVKLSPLSGRVDPEYVCQLPLVRGIEKGLRLIDVDANNIIDAPDACEYAALSYVWGSTNSLLLLQETSDKLYSPGGLGHFKIPRTIGDAIEVTRRIGQRYLWVDAVCIQQDDAEDKARQIFHMDNIYSNAIVTIVSAGGDHADSGLCGINPTYPRRPPVIAESQGFRFIAASPSFWDLLSAGRSPWATRAWTYQESRLSRRMLIFSEDGVLWKCQSSERPEDWVSEVQSDGVQIAVSSRNLWASERSILGDRWDYPRLVSHYGTRRMTYDSDGLNAISSILSVSASGMKDGYLCGLLVSTLLEQGLFWFPFASSPQFRRRGPSLKGHNFPTWSWVGWVGPVWYVDFRDRAAELDPKARIIRRWAIEHPYGVLRSDLLHFPRAAWPMTSDVDDSLQKNDALKRIETGILCFEAMLCHFSIGTECWAQFEESRDVDCSWTGLYKIFSGGVWIGSVHLSHEARKELGNGFNGLHEFIATAQSVDVETDLWEVESNRFDPEADIDWTRLYDPALNDVNDGHVYYVLLLKHDGDVFTRQGIGQIHKASWEVSPWDLEQIRLA